MIKLVEESKERESEKVKILAYLTGKETIIKGKVDNFHRASYNEDNDEDDDIYDED